MKRIAMPIIAAVLLLGVQSANLAAPGETQTLTGEFHWSERDATGPLEAVFTPTSENTWDVSFHFEFRGRSHTYSGTAEGSLTDGALSGTVLNDDKQRTFKFSGSFEDGTFNGTHSEMREEGAAETGTLSLRG